MAKVQITQELFAALIKYHLLDMEEDEKVIKEGLTEKMDAVVRREIYTKYKTEKTEGERETARQEYLEKIGMQKEFRW